MIQTNMTKGEFQQQGMVVENETSKALVLTCTTASWRVSQFSKFLNVGSKNLHLLKEPQIKKMLTICDVINMYSNFVLVLTTISEK